MSQSGVSLEPSLAGIRSRSLKRKRQELTDEQKQEISEAFNLFDTDKDGKIGYHELKVRLVQPRSKSII